MKSLSHIKRKSVQNTAFICWYHVFDVDERILHFRLWWDKNWDYGLSWIKFGRGGEGFLNYFWEICKDIKKFFLPRHQFTQKFPRSPEWDRQCFTSSFGYSRCNLRGWHSYSCKCWKWVESACSTEPDRMLIKINYVTKKAERNVFDQIGRTHQFYLNIIGPQPFFTFMRIKKFFYQCFTNHFSAHH